MDTDLRARERRVVRSIRSGFVTGLLLIAPLAITVFVVQLVYGWIVGTVEPFLTVALREVGPVVELVAVVVLGLSITVLGLVVRHGVGHYLVEEVDEMAKSIPVVRTIYSSVRQASSAFVGDEESFERVALVEWPREGYHTVGFVTDATPEELATALELAGEPDEPRYNVYVPMSPNPTGGYLAIVPESKLVPTDMAVGDALNMMITTGAGGDGEFSPEQFADRGGDRAGGPTA
jgi:uncharacterized membrane protein